MPPATLLPLPVRSVAALHRLFALPPPAHPLVSVVDLATDPCHAHVGPHGLVFDFYSVWLKTNVRGQLRYGQQPVDFTTGQLFMLAPGQVLATHRHAHSDGWGVVFAPALLHGHALATAIRRYAYFDYGTTAALHATEAEEALLTGVVQHLAGELRAPPDASTPALLVTHLELLLRYLERFYQRQFRTLPTAPADLLTRFEAALAATQVAHPPHLPTVQALAGQLAVSPDHLSEQLRTLTGYSAQQHIHRLLLAQARELLSTTTLSISEIAFRLGYEHPQSFSKLFKSKEDCSPAEFRRRY